MTLALSTTTRNALGDALDAEIGATGELVIFAGGAGGTELATITLGNPAFGAAAAGVITMAGVPLSTSAVATGTANAFEFYPNGTQTNGVVTGSVGTSGQDLNLTSVSITSGQTVEITSFTFTVPA